jgi:nucleotide-binding universal stress UspA family protein
VSTDGSFRIVVGVDGSRLSLLALDWALTEGRMRGATLRVLTAWEYPAVVAGMEGVLETANVETAARHTQSTALGKFTNHDVEVTADVVHGPAAKALIDASRAADLVVVGSRGYGGFAGLLMGSVSSQVMHHAACTVTVVRDRRY